MSTSTSTFKVDFDLQMAKLNADLAKMNSDIQGMTTKTKARFNSLSGALAAGMFEGVSQKMSQMSSDIESMTSKIKSSFANMSSGIATGLLQGVGQKLASVVGSAMAAPGKALGQALTDSMELTAVNRKFDIVFGGLRGKAEEFSKTFAESISGSLTDTKAMMARFQDTLVPIGFNRRESFDKSKTMTTLATDLSASEPGITTDDASKRLQSALVGNHEAVRIFGISLSETAMKQELFNMGIKDGASKATELEKATARLNLIMRGSKDAQGAASRASGDLRQQMGGFSSVFTETSARIGTIFAPALAQIVGFFKEMGSEINKAIGPSDRWGATLAEATKNVLATFKDVKQTVVDVSQGFASFTSSMSNGLLKATTDWSTFSDSMGKVFDHAIVMLKPFMLRIQDGVQQSFAGIAGALMGVFGAAESTIKGVIDSILAAMQDVIESIEKAINLTAVLNPMTVARRIERGAEHSRNDYSMNRDSRVSHFKREFHEAVAKDPLRGMWSMQQSDKGVSVNKQAERYARANEETEHRKKANAIDKKYGVDEYGNPLKNSEASRSVSEAREKMKGSSETIGEWMAEASKKMQAGFKNAFDHYGKNSPLSGAIDQAEEAKTKAGVIAKDKGIIGWIDDLLVKGKSLARSVGEDANEIGGKLSGMAEIEADKKDKIEKAKDPYEKYLADNANKPMQYSSSEDLGKKMQAAFDNNDGAALQLKAQQAIQLATTEANRKIQTLAADIGRVVNKSMAWGE